MRESFTYVIQRGADGPVKIGRSQNPAERLRQLQTASAEPLSLVGAIEEDVEQELHDFLDSERLEGEWFRPSNVTARFLEDFGIEIGRPHIPATRVAERAEAPSGVTWEHRYTYRYGPEADARAVERYWCAVCETTYGDPA